jgi:ubiquinone/menaquinone biosynthesis C-methylase UbiE
VESKEKPRPRPADWQLPPGVNRGLWDYVHDPQLARGYDASLAGSSLFLVDERFVDRHCPPSGRLLDLGCGTGRLPIAMVRQGREVLGVDLSEAMLSVAAEKAEAAGVAVRLVRANLVELDGIADGAFDCAACLFSTLGMVTGAANRRRVVAHVFRVLRPGGRFVLHVHNRWFNLWNRSGRAWLLRNWLAARAGRVEAGDRVMPVHQGVAGLTLHLFTRGEAVRLLREAGFQVVEVRPIGLRDHGELPAEWFFACMRAYGYLIAAEKPARCT